MSYILTHSGVKAGLGYPAPPLADIAHALARIPRFAGHGIEPYSVLDHTLFTYCMAKETPLVYAFPALPLAMLLHDAHEAITSDIPSPVKSVDMKQAQWALDTTIMDEYFPGGHDAYDYLHDMVAKLDRNALLVEAYRVGPLGAYDDTAGVVEHFGAAPRHADIATFDYMVDSETNEETMEWQANEWVGFVLKEAALIIDMVDF